MTKTNKNTSGNTKTVSGNTLSQTRGRTFEGTVTKKFPNRVVVEFERTVFVKKYERFYKKLVRLHARLPQGMDVNLGDYIKIRECRPLSKIIHAIVIEVVRKADGTFVEAAKGAKK
ncbi:MAG: 30S ribosomal protein S17 [archaeon]